MPLKLEKAVSPSAVAVVVEPDEPIVDGNVASSPDPVVPVDLDDPAVTSLRILRAAVVLVPIVPVVVVPAAVVPHVVVVPGVPVVVVPVVPAVPAVVPVDTGDLKPPAMTNVLPMTAHPG